MSETLKSIAFVIVAVMVALVLQAHAAHLSTDETESSYETVSYEQLQPNP